MALNQTPCVTACDRPSTRWTTWTLVFLISLLTACAPSEDAGQQESDLVERLDPTRSYEDRLVLLDRLVQAHPVPDGWPDARDGIRMQTEWQMDSGRAEPNENGELQSWWAHVNWTLTVWQVEALQARGELTNIQLVRWKDYQPDQEVREALYRYYDALDEAHTRADASAATRLLETRKLNRLLWDYHVEAIHDGLADNEGWLGALPEEERRFGEAWGYSIVEIVAATNAPTHRAWLEPTADITMPPRVLGDGDIKLTGRSDLAWPLRMSLVAFDKIHSFEQLTGGLLLKAMRNFASTEERAGLAAHIVLEALQEEDPVQFLWWALWKHDSSHDSLPRSEPP